MYAFGLTPSRRRAQNGSDQGWNDASAGRRVAMTPTSLYGVVGDAPTRYFSNQPRMYATLAIMLLGLPHGRRGHLADVRDRRTLHVLIEVLPWKAREPIPVLRRVVVRRQHEAVPVDHRLLHDRRAKALRVSDDPRREHTTAAAAGDEQARFDDRRQGYQVTRLYIMKPSFLVDFEKGIDDRGGDVTVEQGLVGSHPAISSRPLKAVSWCLCRYGLPLRSRFCRPFISVSSGCASPSTATLSAEFPACRASRNSLTQGCRRKVSKTLYPVTDLVVGLGRQVNDLDAKFFRQRICDQRPMTVRGVRLEAEETDASPLAYQRRQYFKLGLSLFGREV